MCTIHSSALWSHFSSTSDIVNEVYVIGVQIPLLNMYRFVKDFIPYKLEKNLSLAFTLFKNGCLEEVKIKS